MNFLAQILEWNLKKAVGLLKLIALIICFYYNTSFNHAHFYTRNYIFSGSLFNGLKQYRYTDDNLKKEYMNHATKIAREAR